MNTRSTTGRSVLAIATSFAIAAFSCFCEAQDAGQEFTREFAMDLMQEDVGLWKGVETVYGADGASTENRVTVLNKMEAGAWLYFQVARKADGKTRLTKGTLEFDAEAGNFVRRWFDNGNASIKNSLANFDMDKVQLSFTVDKAVARPQPASEPTDGKPETDGAMTSPLTRKVTTEILYSDANRRTIKVYSKLDDGTDSARKLLSELVLERANGERKESVASKRNRTKTDEQDEADEEQEAVTHTLQVRIYVGGELLSKGQDPEIAISPDDAEGERISDDTVEFKGLKPGVDYKVSGEYQLESGLRVKTAGSTSWKFDKDAERALRKTKVLRLEVN